MRAHHEPAPETGRASTSALTTEPDPPAQDEERAGEFINSVGMRFVKIPAGTFMMGSAPTEKWHEPAEGKLHAVRISSSFWMGQYEVTQGQYELVTGKNPSTHHSDPRLPVTNVDWNGAVEFCRALSSREGRHYRLPTEAEWEYACRAGASTPWFFGDAPDNLNQYVVCGGGAAVDRPATVGSRKPNPWGLYDMLGNVAEWVSDEVSFERSNRPGGSSSHQFDLPPYADRRDLDPGGQERGAGRIVRGGSYAYAEHEKDFPDAAFCARACRCATRDGRYPFMAAEDVGFRIVCASENSNAAH